MIRNSYYDYDDYWRTDTTFGSRLAAAHDIFSMKHAAWLLGSRDEVVEFSVHALRAKRAAINYMESLPAFLALALLAKIDGVDLGDLPMYWLICRAVYALLYLAGTPVVRSLV